MFNLFKKKKLPPFEALQRSPIKDKYFLRKAEWDWLDPVKRSITVIDPHAPRMLTFDPWPELIFLSANGQLTIAECVYFMAGKYSSAVPAVLDKTILDEIETLLGYDIIMLSDVKQPPVPKFELQGRDKNDKKALVILIILIKIILIIMWIVTIITFIVLFLIAFILVLGIALLIQMMFAAPGSSLRRYRTVLLFCAAILAGFATFFFLHTSPASNDSIASISQRGNHYQITVTGRRIDMVHDPVSAFKRNTHKASKEFIIPRKEGIIKGEELPVPDGYYKYKGQLIIKGTKLTLDLLIDNTDDDKLEPDSWNGEYTLEWY